MQKKSHLFITLLIVFFAFTSCKIETGYRVEIKQYVDKFNEAFLAFQLFLQIDHRGKEVEAENDLNLIYQQFDILRSDVKAMTPPTDGAQRKFHNLFTSAVNFTKGVVDDYRQKFRVEISITNIEAENKDINDKLEITKRNFQSAQTAGGKSTYRERIVSLTQELEEAKKNLETTRSRYIEILSKIISSEDYYNIQYPEVVKLGKTSVLLSLFPPPKALISPEDRQKYFPFNSGESSITPVR